MDDDFLAIAQQHPSQEDNPTQYPYHRLLAVTYASPTWQTSAQAIADTLKCQFIATKTTTKDRPYLLIVGEQLYIHQQDNFAHPLHIDFLSTQYAKLIQKNAVDKILIAKAAGILSRRAKRVLDTTAGFMGDSYVLANLGCAVLSVERCPLISTLLQQALTKAKENQYFAKLPLALLAADSNDLINHYCDDWPRPEVILIDTMFPKNKTALPQKNMQYCRELLGKDHRNDNLFAACVRLATDRIIIKRHRHSENLTGSRTPDFSIVGNKAIRFDVYTT